MENNENNEKNMPQGWRDLQFGLDLNVEQFLGLINSFNQRLALLEDNVFVRDENGGMISITEFIKRQAEAQMVEYQKRMAEKQAKANESAPEETPAA